VARRDSDSATEIPNTRPRTKCKPLTRPCACKHSVHCAYSLTHPVLSSVYNHNSISPGNVNISFWFLCRSLLHAATQPRSNAASNPEQLNSNCSSSRRFVLTDALGWPLREEGRPVSASLYYASCVRCRSVCVPPRQSCHAKLKVPLLYSCSCAHGVRCCRHSTAAVAAMTSEGAPPVPRRDVYALEPGHRICKDATCDEHEEWPGPSPSPVSSGSQALRRQGTSVLAVSVSVSVSVSVPVSIPVSVSVSMSSRHGQTH
jgi:hypothetical protein